MAQNSAIQPHGTDAGTGMITDPWELLANLTLTQTYIPEYVQTGISPSWSLTLEILRSTRCCRCWVSCSSRCVKRTDVKPLVLACLAPAILLVVGIVERLFAPLVFAASGADTVMMQNWGPTWAAVFMRSFITNADLFAYGMFAAILFVAIETGRHLRAGGQENPLPVLPAAAGVLCRRARAGGEGHRIRHCRNRFRIRSVHRDRRPAAGPRQGSPISRGSSTSNRSISSG